MAKFDLTLSITENADGLLASMEYSSELFDESTIDRMLGHFQPLLEGIVGDADMPISQLPMMSEAEMRLVMGEWSSPNPDEDALELDGLTGEEFDSLLLGLDKKGVVDE